MHGCGGRTFLQLFIHHFPKDMPSMQVHLFDPEIEKLPLIKFVSNKIRSNHNSLVFVRSFEKIDNKKTVLEKLNSLIHTNNGSLLFLVETNHDGIVNPENYYGTSTQFFQDRFYMSPFDLERSKEMIKINDEYYGWNTPKKYHQDIYQLSGGIPRLIKHICKDINEREADMNSYMKFFSNPSIRFQLDYMSKLLINYPEYLTELQIVNSDAEIRSILLKEYFSAYKSNFVSEIYPELTELELKLFTYLYENEKGLTGLNELGDIFDKAGHEFSPWAIYKHISRLKKKIADKFEIKTFKNRGYKLATRK